MLDWLVIRYFDKFRDDIKEWVIDPLSGATKPEWIAQFADVNAHALLVHQPAVVGARAGARDRRLAGVVWLLAVRRERAGDRGRRVPAAILARRRAKPRPWRRSFATRCRWRRRWRSPPAILCADLIAKPRWRAAGLGVAAARGRLDAAVGGGVHERLPAARQSAARVRTGSCRTSLPDRRF